MSELSREEIEQFFEARGFPRFAHCEIRDMALRALSQPPDSEAERTLLANAELLATTGASATHIVELIRAHLARQPAAQSIPKPICQHQQWAHRHGHDQGYEVEWCFGCGQVLSFPGTGEPILWGSSAGKADRSYWCHEHVKGWSCSYESKGDERCEYWCGDTKNRGCTATLYEQQPATQSDTPLNGHWQHGNGFIGCGTLRIAREDFDTQPVDLVKKRILDWVCVTLNAAQGQPAAQSDSAIGHTVAEGTLDYHGLPMKYGRYVLEQPAAREPEGQWVPKEPTEAMYDAFASVNCTRSTDDECITFSGDFGNFFACYQAMLRASEPTEGESK